MAGLSVNCASLAGLVLARPLVELTPTLSVTPFCDGAVSISASCYAANSACSLDSTVFTAQSVIATPSLQAQVGQLITVQPAPGYQWSSTGLASRLPLQLQCTRSGAFTPQPPEVQAVGCPAWPYAIANGALMPPVSAVGGTAYLVCSSGYAADSSGPSAVTCLPSLSYSSAVLADCVPSSAGAPQLYGALSHYSLSLDFASFVLPASAVLSSVQYSLLYELLFPTASNIDLSNPSEAGILQTQSFTISAAQQSVEGSAGGVLTVSSGSLGTPGSVLVASLQTDSGSHIEGLQLAVSYQVSYTDNTGQPRTSALSSPLLQVMPCGCDIADNPSGAPWQTGFTESMGSINQLLLAWTPNSLCADTYRINSSTTPLSIADITTYYAESEGYCNLIQPVTTVLGAVSWQMTGRPQSVCIYPLPMPICIGCTGIYPNTAPQYYTCVSFTPQWYITVSGTVMTAPSASSPQSAPVLNATLTALVYSLQGALQYESPGVPVQAVATSSSTGAFTLTLVSSVLTAQYYNLTIVPSKVDVLSIPSSTNSSRSSTSHFVHSFSISSLSSGAEGGGGVVSVSSQAVTHAQVVTGVTFYDLSSLSLSGSVVLNSKAAGSQLGGSNFDQCGVAGVTVSAYAASQYSAAAVAAGLQPIVQSAASAADGSFGLSADLNTIVTLVPQLGDHVFSPTSITVSIGSAGVAILTKNVKSLQFADITTRAFTLSLTGGLCGAFVGFVRPVYELQSQCHMGGALQLELTSFSTAPTVYLLPALPITVFLFSSTVGSSGLQSDPSMQPQYQSTVNGWLLQQTQTADLTTRNYSAALQFFNSSTVSIDPSSFTTPCTDSQPNGYNNALLPSQQQYAVLQQGATQPIRFVFSQLYGYGALASSCPQTTGDALYVVDHVTASSQTCYSRGCTLTPVYDPVRQQTAAVYTTTAAGPDFAVSVRSPAQQGSKLQPDFTSSISYTLTSTGQTASLYVLVTGAVLLGQPTALPWSPGSPLFVARRPPGGSSSATIQSGTSYTTRWRATQHSETGSRQTSLTWTGSRDVTTQCEGADVGESEGEGVGESEGVAEGIGTEAVELMDETESEAEVEQETSLTCEQAEYGLSMYANQYLGLDQALINVAEGWLANFLKGTAEKAIKQVGDKFTAVTKAGKAGEKVADDAADKVAAASHGDLHAGLDAADSGEQEDLNEALNNLFKESDAGASDETADLEAVEEPEPAAAGGAPDGEEVAAEEGAPQEEAAALKSEVSKDSEAADAGAEGEKASLLHSPKFYALLTSSAKFSVDAANAAWNVFNAQSALLSEAQDGSTGVLGWLTNIGSELGLSSGEQVTTSTADLGQSMSMSSTFSYDYSTPTRADYVDGDGDMFLLVNSFFSVGQSQLLSASATPYLNGSCPVQYQPDVLSWQSGTQTTLQWISQHDVVHTVLPRLLLTSAALAAQYELTSFPFSAAELAAAADSSPELAVGSPAYQHVQAVGQSVQGWLGLLVNNAVAKATAVPFLHQFDEMAFSSFPNVTQRPNHTSLGVDTGDINSPLLFTFYGGGGSSTVTMQSRSSNSLDASAGSYGTQDTLLNAGYSVTNIFGIELTQDGQEWELSHLNDDVGNTTSMEQFNSITYTFSDPDPDDSFTVEVMRDIVWGSPVFVTLAGQSHCVTEQNTTQRELISIFQLQQPSFTHVGTAQAISTMVTMQSGSQTGESWPYWLEVMSESNPYGLSLSINGQPLGARSHRFVLPADVAVQATLSIERPVTATSFDFPDIQLHLYSKPNWCTELCDIVCTEAFLPLSVSYAQPCSQVQFAGSLGLLDSFTVNAQSGSTLPVVIYNPEAGVAGRRWTDVNQTSLISIAVQYRAAGSTLESDWLPMINAGTDLPVAPLYDQSAPPSADGDYYAFSWAVAELSGDYELRAATSCQLQGGTDQTSLAATDPSLLSYATPVISGRIDYELPQLLSYSAVLILNNYNAAPLIAAAPLYFPGQPLLIAFNEPILCSSANNELQISAFATPSASPTAAQLSAAPGFSMLSYCEDNAVAFTFDPSSTAWTQLVAQYVTVTLTGMTDRAGNSPSAAYPLQFVLHVGSWTPGQQQTYASTASLSAALHSSSSSTGGGRHSNSSSSSGSKAAAASSSSGVAHSSSPSATSSAPSATSTPHISSSSSSARLAVSSSSKAAAKRKVSSSSSSSH